MTFDFGRLRTLSGRPVRSHAALTSSGPRVPETEPSYVARLPPERASYTTYDDSMGEMPAMDDASAKRMDEMRETGTTSVRVVALAIAADYVTEDEYNVQLIRSALSRQEIEESIRMFSRTMSISIEQYALLSDNRRLLLGRRGFSSVTHDGAVGERVNPWANVTRADVIDGVLSCGLPYDDGVAASLPQEWFVEKLRGYGISAVGQQLERLPYEVVLSPRLDARLVAASGPPS